MSGRRMAFAFLLCVSALYPGDNAVAQDVKATSDKSVDFKKYKKYSWGSNYLLTRQTKEDQERINMAIVDSINRTLQAGGFIEDDKSPDFRITYEAGGLPKTDVCCGHGQLCLGKRLRNFLDVWVYSLAKMKITVTDAATKSTVWQGMASKKIRDPMKLMDNLKDFVDQYIQKTMKSFPPKK